MRTVRLVDPARQYQSLREEILSRFDEISRKGAYVLTEDVRAFEENFARYCETEYAVGVGSGSDALYLSLRSLGIGEGDEVITVPNSFVATAWAIARTGARIVFCDVGDDMNIDANLIESVVTERTRAILPVHLTGRVADMDRIQAVADRYNLRVIEDAAQAVGAGYKGKRAGSFGICAGFSLHPLKNLHVHGDGGVVTSDSGEVYETLVKFRNHGLKNREECEVWGVNSRLDAVQAGIADLKLEYLDQWNSRFREIARRYTENLAGYVQVPREKDYERPVYHRYMIRHHERDRLQAFLVDRGIETTVNYPIPVHLQRAASNLGYKKGDFPVAEKLAGTILSLPIYPELEDEEVCYVIDSVIEYCREHRHKNAR